MKKHKVLKIFLITLAIIFIGLILTVYIIFGDRIKAAKTVTKLTDNVYSMEYHGDYGFDEFIENGGAATDDEMGQYIASFLSGGLYKYKPLTNTTACSTISVNKGEDVLLGRNFDWDNCKVMVVKTYPKNGYASISTANIDFLGFGEDFTPDKDDTSKFMALASVYVPLDGINEKGLCIADLVAGDDVETHQDTQKSDLTITSAIRLILDRAATVDEAITLLSAHDMNSSINAAHHFAITDTSGKSVIVEYINNEMYITETPIVTNFYLTLGEKYGIGSDQSKERFEVLEKFYKDSNGKMNNDEVMNALEAVSQGNFDDFERTQWSIVFDTSNKTADYCFTENYEKKYHFSLADN